MIVNEKSKKLNVFSKKCNKNVCYVAARRNDKDSNADVVLGWCNSSWSKHGGWKKPTRW